MSEQVISGTDRLLLYVRLLDEGTDVFRPVWAEPLGSGVYELIAPSDYDPEDEEWEFLPGTHVSVSQRQGETEEMFVAAPLLGGHTAHKAQGLSARR